LRASVAEPAAFRRRPLVFEDLDLEDVAGPGPCDVVIGPVRGDLSDGFGAIEGDGVPGSMVLPVCTHHHSKIHDAGWMIELGSNGDLTVRFPDGTLRNTGPPSRRAA
jgi:hypothetical protein